MDSLGADELKEIKSWPWKFDAETEVGKLTCTYDPTDAMNYFERYFMQLLTGRGKHTYDVTQFMICVSHAQTLLYRNIQAILKDAMKQAVREVRVRTLSELNNNPVFLRQLVPPDYPDPPKPFPVIAFKLHPEDKPSEMISRVAEFAMEEAKKRMNAPKKGGKKAKIVGYDRALIDEHYDELRATAHRIKKSIMRKLHPLKKGTLELRRNASLEEVRRRYPEWEKTFEYLFENGYEPEAVSPSEIAYARLRGEYQLDMEYLKKLISQVRRSKKEMLNQQKVKGKSPKSRRS